jgi:hypothetical protein
MGFDIQMVEPPTAAEVKKAQLDHDDPGYFRFNWSAMPVMVVTMAWAGAVVEEKAPAWPAWPPKGTPDNRKELLEESLYDKLDPKLTVAEKKATIAMRGELDKLRATRSKQRGKVPSFKFAANDGYVVSAAECAIIATKLRAFAKQVTADKLIELEKLYREAQQPLVDAAKQRGETVIIGNQPLGLTLDEYRAWILQWAAYNDVASHHRGYSIN